MWRDTQGNRRPLNRVGSISPSVGLALVPLILTVGCPQRADILTFERAAACCDKSLPRQPRGNLLVHFACGVEFDRSAPQPLQIDVVAIGVDPPLERVLTCRSRLRQDLDLAVEALLVVRSADFVE